MYPTTDLIYTVGVSDWRRDWFFAHVCRYERNVFLFSSFPQENVILYCAILKDKSKEYDLYTMHDMIK